MVSILTDKDAHDLISTRQRPENDVYPTPRWSAVQTLERIQDEFKGSYILDVGAGSGVWGEAASHTWPNVTGIHGVEIRDLPNPGWYDDWFAAEDFLSTFPDYGTYGLVMGNPPYKDAEAFVRKAISLVCHDGWVAFLLPITFLNSQRRAKLYKEFPPRYVIPFSKRPSFSGNGKTKNGEYCSVYWQKGHQGKTWIEWV